MTTAKSVYPIPVEELLPQARKLAARLGEVPSRNRLMSELKIGAKKANTILDQLTGTENGDSAAGPGTTRLHLVPETTAPESTGEPEPDTPTDADGEANPAETTEQPVSEPVPDSADDSAAEPVTEKSSAQAAVDANPAPSAGSAPAKNKAGRVSTWPVLLLALPAFVAIWSGWVGLGSLTGFGIVHPLPGIADGFALNTAITLPIGVETYAAYALRVWLSGQVPARARRFAKYSALGSLALGALGQIAYHLMDAAGMTTAPWWITTLVACLPVAVLGMGAALTHLLHDTDTDDRPEVA